MVALTGAVGLIAGLFAAGVVLLLWPQGVGDRSGTSGAFSTWTEVHVTVAGLNLPTFVAIIILAYTLMGGVVGYTFSRLGWNLVRD